eukprot:jgi/Bigna1/71224/fgenesh1_pg.15_\
MSTPEDEELTKLAASQLIEEATRAEEYAKTGGALSYMEYMKRRQPNPRFAGAVVSSVVKSNMAMQAKEEASKVASLAHVYTDCCDQMCHLTGSLLALTQNPGGKSSSQAMVDELEGDPKVGGIYDGIVMSVKSFGAFVDFGFSQDGMVHVSKMTVDHLDDPNKMVYPGDRVTVKVEKVEPTGKTSLSMIGLNPNLQPTEDRDPPPPPPRRRRPRPSQKDRDRGRRRGGDEEDGEGGGEGRRKKIPGLAGYVPPDWAAEPRDKDAELEVQKDGKMVKKMPIGRKFCMLFGREKNASQGVYCRHPSISRQHAVILHDRRGRVKLMDLDSKHGTFLDNERLEPNEATRLRDGDSFKLGASSREYIVRLSKSSPARSRWDRGGSGRRGGSRERRRRRGGSRDSSSRERDRSRDRDHRRSGSSRRRRRRRRRGDDEEDGSDDDNKDDEERNQRKKRKRDFSDDNASLGEGSSQST